jgi:hypothetical protein
MILVDTSVWIELLAGKRGVSLREDDLPDLVTCGPVVQEVLQGLWPGPASDAFREAFLAVPILSDPIPLALFLSAADITIRSSVDCLIAAIAIENRVPVWHWDRDFTAIARYTTLETV